jgi:hypothetical protein
MGAWIALHRLPRSRFQSDDTSIVQIERYESVAEAFLPLGIGNGKKEAMA